MTIPNALREKFGLNPIVNKDERMAEPVESIPYLMHKETGCPLMECKKAYDLAMEYLRNKARVKG